MKNPSPQIRILEQNKKYHLLRLKSEVLLQIWSLTILNQIIYCKIIKYVVFSMLLCNVFYVSR